MRVSDAPRTPRTRGGPLSPRTPMTPRSHAGFKPLPVLSSQEYLTTVTNIVVHTCQPGAYWPPLCAQEMPSSSTPLTPRGVYHPAGSRLPRPKPSARNPNLQHSTLNPSLNPQPSTLNPTHHSQPPPPPSTWAGAGSKQSDPQARANGQSAFKLFLYNHITNMK